MRKKSGKKKKTKRSRVKYPALDPSYMPKVRQEFLDIDYLNQLSPKEKEWLNKFMEEHLNASFKNNKTDLTKTKEQKKKIYNQNNARNRDLYAISKANGLLQLESSASKREIINTHSSGYNLTEDTLIDKIDNPDEE